MALVCAASVPMRAGSLSVESISPGSGGRVGCQSVVAKGVSICGESVVYRSVRRCGVVRLLFGWSVYACSDVLSHSRRFRGFIMMSAALL